VIKKRNLQLGVGGLLIGSIVGFVFAGSLNGGTPRQRGGASQHDTSQSPIAQTSDATDKKMIDTASETVQLAKREPENFEAQMRAAEVYYQIEGYDKAIGYLLRANQIRPDDDEVLVALGNINFVASHLEEAEKWFEMSLGKHPDDVNIRTNLGMTFLFRERPDLERAITEFRRSLSRNPLHESTLQNLVIALARKGERAQAQAMLDQLERAYPKNTALEELRLEVNRMSKATSQTAIR
jgi:tetratricopeptide (TPR) repeat protein